MSTRPGSLVSLPDTPASGTPDPQVVQTGWARTFMMGLYRAGVRRAVISPGSRSTPFVLAAEFAGMQTHTVIDERTAGFFALGCARVTAAPVALICTSGSAGAHYFPAVIEAAQSFVPLVVITADRPPALHDCAAPQTIDQTRLFGHWARLFMDLGPADSARSSLRALARKAAQVVHRACGPTPGPVHVNAPAQKPLEPGRALSAADRAMEHRVDRIARTVTPRVMDARVQADPEALDTLARALAATCRGLIVAGPSEPRGPHHQADDLARAAYGLARATGFPLLAEASSQLRFATVDPGCQIIDGFDALLSSHGFRQNSQAELIVHIGRPPTSRYFADYMAENLDCVHCVIAAHGWNDPHSSADMLITADVVDTLDRLSAAVARQRATPDVHGAAPDVRHAAAWAEQFSTGNELVWRSVDRVLANPENNAMSEGQAMRAISTALPRGALLALGNSLPIRTVDTYCPAGSAAVDVMSQRGANGIDGLVSSAAGAAWARGPVVLVLGDVSFLHDLGGLALAARASTPLCIVVMDNDGGRIFEFLPVARAETVSKELFATHWLTRPACNIEAAAAVFGIAYAGAATPHELAAAVRTACDKPGCTIVHARVEPGSAARDAQRIVAAISAGMAEKPATNEDP